MGKKQVKCQECFKEGTRVICEVVAVTNRGMIDEKIILKCPECEAETYIRPNILAGIYKIDRIDFQ